VTEATRTIRIPRTNETRGALTYARLLLRVWPRRTFAAFDGKFFKPGAKIEEADLWPTPEYPAVPLLLEYAGSDRTGRGHRRANDIYLLWRYERETGEWVALLRYTGQGTEWIAPIKRRALAELARTEPPISCTHASDVCVRVLAALDHELELLDNENRHLVMSFVYQEFSARAVAYAA
jgi:hypothetical protein